VNDSVVQRRLRLALDAQDMVKDLFRELPPKDELFTCYFDGRNLSGIPLAQLNEAMVARGLEASVKDLDLDLISFHQTSDSNLGDPEWVGIFTPSGDWQRVWFASENGFVEHPNFAVTTGSEDGVHPSSDAEIEREPDPASAADADEQLAAVKKNGEWIWTTQTGDQAMEFVTSFGPPGPETVGLFAKMDDPEYFVMIQRTIGVSFWSMVKQMEPRAQAIYVEGNPENYEVGFHLYEADSIPAQLVPVDLGPIVPDNTGPGDFFGWLWASSYSRWKPEAGPWVDVYDD
jgi:hypothetical protein